MNNLQLSVVIITIAAELELKFTLIEIDGLYD